MTADVRSSHPRHVGAGLPTDLNRRRGAGSEFEGGAGEEVAFGDVGGGLTTFALEPNGAGGVGRKVLDPLRIASNGRDVDAITDPRGDEWDFACLAALSAGGLDHDDADTYRQG